MSKVLNGRPDVSARTRTLVQDIIVNRGYRKRAASAEAPPVIDVVFSDFDSPWAIEIVRGAAAAAQAEGLTVALTALSEADERRVWFDHITSRGTARHHPPALPARPRASMRSSPPGACRSS